MKRFLSILVISFTIYQSAFAQSSTYNVLDYGAINDGKTISTRALQKAIDDCAEKGGGTVYFPAGTFVSGTLFLKSFVSLYLERGSVLEGSTDINDYPVTISQVRSYTDNYTNKSLIYAEGLENISITGKGAINGNGAAFKVEPMKNDDDLRKKDNWAFYKTRPFLIRIINCKNILVRDVTIQNSPMWVQHYLKCENVNIDGITINSRVNNNNDGINIDGCNNVRISNCNIISGDDAIVLKSTLDEPCQNITITNCNISSHCAAFKLGTESNGGFHNITFSNSTIYDTRLSGIALEMVDGGSLNHVNISNITMKNIGTAIFIRLGNRARPFKENMPKPGMGVLYNVIISNVQAYNIGNIGCSITGLPSNPAKNITLENIRLVFRGGGTKDLIDRDIPEFPEKYPAASMFGMLPAYGFYCRHLENLKFNNVELDFISPDERPALICENVEGIEIHRLKARVNDDIPLIKFKNVRHALIQSSIAPIGSETFLQVSGTNTAHITLSGNDLSGAKNAIVKQNNTKVYLNSNRLK